MTVEEARIIVENDILPLYKEREKDNDAPTILVASMGLFTALCELSEGTGEIENRVKLHWSGSEEECTWTLI